jgi:predicted RNA-binding Zn-ribbon protein involved in translation (DUF1610 family)
MAEVGVRYTSVRSVKTETTYTCKACGHVAPVSVLGIGHASSDAAHLLGNYDAAKERSAVGAVHEAHADVKWMLGLVPCPKCGQRDPAWVRRFYLKHGLRILGVLACVAFGTLFIFGRAGGMTVLVASLIASVIAVAIYFWAVDPRFDWNRASMCVKFLPDARPGADSPKI